MKYISHNLHDTARTAEKFLTNVLQKQAKMRNSAYVVLLSGNLGAGKTAFVKAIAKILGVKEKVASPTFVLMRKYKIPNPPPLSRGGVGGGVSKTMTPSGLRPSPPWQGERMRCSSLIHIDAYRLESRKELDALGWDEISHDPRSVIFLEWPEKVFTRAPKGARKIKFKFVDERTREIDFL